MMGLFEGFSKFFTRHRAHCVVHEVYQNDCEACVAANQSGYMASGPIVFLDDTSGDSSPSADKSGLDTSSTDSSSSSDSSSSDTSDFGGFDGGDSGGGGASGDF